MNFYTLAKNDFQSIVTNLNAWGKSIILTNPVTSQSVTAAGIHTKHHLGIDENGVPINTKNAHVTFSEPALIELGYIVRNASGEVEMVGHLVTVADSNNNSIEYVIQEQFPDETVGLIVCILGDYAEN